MAKMKKLNSLSDLGGVVYSTKPNFEFENRKVQEEPLREVKQHLEVHLQKKGRGGKIVILIKGFKGSNDELKKLAKGIKTHCALGGSVKNGVIIIQGNVRSKVVQYFSH